MEFFYQTKQVVVDRNEDGDVIGDVFQPIIELPSGQRFAHQECFGDVSKADSFVTTCEEMNSAGENVLMTLEDEWHETDPRYGSAHHQNIGDAHLMDSEELSHRSPY